VKIGRDFELDRARLKKEGTGFFFGKNWRKKMATASLTRGPEKAVTQGAEPQTAREREGRR
jgi:hypothetical protein